ncbi:MAG: DUF1049 domain-containing protein [Acidobacteria bacterium]|nr:MAG: DUF1049 domain-containing protein [Acidobacteriota bacterium]
MRIAIFVLLAAFVVAVLWVALANASQEVDLRVGPGLSGRTSLAQVIVGSVLAGALFTGLLAVIEGLSLRVERHRLRRRLRRLEEEIHDLRNLTLSGEDRPAARLDRDAAPGSARLADDT